MDVEACMEFAYNADILGTQSFQYLDFSCSPSISQKRTSPVAGILHIIM